MDTMLQVNAVGMTGIRVLLKGLKHDATDIGCGSVWSEAATDTCPPHISSSPTPQPSSSTDSTPETCHTPSPSTTTTKPLRSPPPTGPNPTAKPTSRPGPATRRWRGREAVGPQPGLRPHLAAGSEQPRMVGASLRHGREKVHERRTTDEKVARHRLRHRRRIRPTVAHARFVTGEAVQVLPAEHQLGVHAIGLF